MTPDLMGHPLVLRAEGDGHDLAQVALPEARPLRQLEGGPERDQLLRDRVLANILGAAARDVGIHVMGAERVEGERRVGALVGDTFEDADQVAALLPVELHGLGAPPPGGGLLLPG
jgi:hypothetical protein